MARSLGWTIDGTCDNAVESSRTLVDFANFSSNVTFQNVIDGLQIETVDNGCANITFVNSSGIGFSLNFTCLDENDLGEYPLINKKTSWFECESVGWDSNINSACNSSNKLEHYFNESDWMDYDFAVITFSDNLGEVFTVGSDFYGWRGENIFGAAQDDSDKWALKNTASARFYENKFIGLFNSSENQLYMPLSSTNYTRTGSYFKTDSDGNSIYFVNNTEFHDYADLHNFIGVRWNFDVENTIEHETYNFVIKNVTLVKKENHLSSIDCAVNLPIENITKNPYKYSGWIVNVTGSRVPINIVAFDEAGDSLIYAYKDWGYYKINREITFGIADSGGWYLPVGNLFGHIQDDFNNTQMWEQVTITGKILYSMLLFDIFDVAKSGDIVQVPYEIVPDFSDYYANHTSIIDRYLGYSSENEGCRFAKFLFKKDDFIIDDMPNSDYNYSNFDFYMQPSADLCDYYGYGCFISGIIPYTNGTQPTNDYDLILLGGICMNRDYFNSIYLVGYALDEYGMKGDGICSLEFESYKGIFEDIPCRINPTFYASYLSDASALFNPIVTGILGIILVGLTVLMFAGKLESKWYMVMVGLLLLSTFVYYTMVNKGLIAV